MPATWWARVPAQSHRPRHKNETFVFWISCFSDGKSIARIYIYIYINHLTNVAVAIDNRRCLLHGLNLSCTADTSATSLYFGALFSGIREQCFITMSWQHIFTMIYYHHSSQWSSLVNSTSQTNPLQTNPLGWLYQSAGGITFFNQTRHESREEHLNFASKSHLCKTIPVPCQPCNLLQFH